MKILAVGDFHGRFPRKISQIVKKEEIDVVVSVGDYPSFTLKKEFFKYAFRDNKPLWNFIGKKKCKEATLKDHASAEKVIRKLDELPVPVVSVLGNHDHPWPNDIIDIRKPKGKDFWKWNWDRKGYLTKFIRKFQNIKLLNYSVCKVNDFVFIGGRGHSMPGRVKSKAFRSHKKKLDNLFKKYKRQNKEGRVIFVYHNSPYNTKLDKITAKDAHDLVKNEHYGSKISRRIIDQKQPILSLSGHIDEGRGKQNLGKTLAVNIGSVHEGWCSIINLKEGKKPKVRFVKLK